MHYSETTSLIQSVVRETISKRNGFIFYMPKLFPKLSDTIDEIVNYNSLANYRDEDILNFDVKITKIKGSNTDFREAVEGLQIEHTKVNATLAGYSLVVQSLSLLSSIVLCYLILTNYPAKDILLLYTVPVFSVMSMTIITFRSFENIEFRKFIDRIELKHE